MSYLAGLFFITIVTFQIGCLYAVHFPWMYYLPYGEDVTLKPLFRNETEVQNLTITSCRWATPKNIILYPGAPNLDTKRYHLDAKLCELTIFNNQKDTNGVYHCTVNEIYISKAMLNVHGAPKKTMLEKYTPNLIAGFSTAGGIIAFFVFTCGIYRYRYRDPNEERTLLENDIKMNTISSNQAFDADEEIIPDEVESIRF